MRLADFIREQKEPILDQWEAFASAQLPAASEMRPLELRDHAPQILEAIAKDLQTPQTREAQSEKSKGRAPVLAGTPETAAQTHATLRARSGFNIIQLVAEYRALRASVLRLWMDAHPSQNQLEPDDMIRFNEAVDQALAESVGFFNTQVEQSRNLMLGMLGHDMRNPLQTIHMTATYLSALNAGADVSEAASRLIKSSSRMRALLDDLLDYNRTTLGLGIKINPSNVDVAKLASEEIGLLRVAHPTRRFFFTVTGDTRGAYDALRIQQMLGNLISNAIKYGKPDSAVHVMLLGNPSELQLDVKNEGAETDQETLNSLFEPLKRGASDKGSRESDGSLGLGLFICREIANAHGGDIKARVDGTSTVLSVRLPRCS